MMSIRFCFIFLFAFNSLMGYSQSIKIAVRADKERILIGEQFNLVIAATLPSERSVALLKIDSFPHFEVIQSKVDSQQSGTDKVYQQTITLTSWDSGKWNIPALSIPGSNRTKPLAIEVVFSSPFDPQQEYHDVKDIMEVPKPEREKWYWYLIGILLLALLFFLLFPRNKKKDTGEFLSDETIYKKSLARLEKLSNQTDQESKVFYTELVQIFRDYLHKRKGVRSHSKTTEEISRKVKQLELKDGYYKPLAQTLELSDMVKFARLETTPADNKDSIEIIKQTIIAIEQTK
jgi:hypothetical protein